MENKILFYILLYLNVLSLFIGYIIGKIGIGFIENNNPKNKVSIKKYNQSTVQPTDITIDDKKLVVDINTSGLEKKYQTLGQVTQTDTDISGSVNKLKNMKK